MRFITFKFGALVAALCAVITFALWPQSAQSEARGVREPHLSANYGIGGGGGVSNPLVNTTLTLNQTGQFTPAIQLADQPPNSRRTIWEYNVDGGEENGLFSFDPKVSIKRETVCGVDDEVGKQSDCTTRLFYNSLAAGTFDNIFEHNIQLGWEWSYRVANGTNSEAFVEHNMNITSPDFVVSSAWTQDGGDLLDAQAAYDSAIGEVFEIFSDAGFTTKIGIAAVIDCDSSPECLMNESMTFTMRAGEVLVNGAEQYFRGTEGSPDGTFTVPAGAVTDATKRIFRPYNFVIKPEMQEMLFTWQACDTSSGVNCPAILRIARDGRRGVVTVGGGSQGSFQAWGNSEKPVFYIAGGIGGMQVSDEAEINFRGNAFIQDHETGYLNPWLDSDATSHWIHWWDNTNEVMRTAQVTTESGGRGAANASWPTGDNEGANGGSAWERGSRSDSHGSSFWGDGNDAAFDSGDEVCAVATRGQLCVNTAALDGTLVACSDTSTHTTLYHVFCK